jgi:hypothetical protein
MRIDRVISVDIKTADGKVHHFDGKGYAHQVDTYSEGEKQKKVPVNYITVTLHVARGEANATTTETPGGSGKSSEALHIPS